MRLRPGRSDEADRFQRRQPAGGNRVGFVQVKPFPSRPRNRVLFIPSCFTFGLNREIHQYVIRIKVVCSGDATAIQASRNSTEENEPQRSAL